MGSSSNFWTVASMWPSVSMLNACAICRVLTLAWLALVTVCAAAASLGTPGWLAMPSSELLIVNRAFMLFWLGGDSGSIADIEQAGLVLIVGSNTAESHPVLATRVKRAHK